MKEGKRRSYFVYSRGGNDGKRLGPQNDSAIFRLIFLAGLFGGPFGRAFWAGLFGGPFWGACMVDLYDHPVRRGCMVGLSGKHFWQTWWVDRF